MRESVPPDCTVTVLFDPSTSKDFISVLRLYHGTLEVDDPSDGNVPLVPLTGQTCSVPA